MSGSPQKFVTSDKIRELQEKCKEPLTLDEIADYFGVGYSTLKHNIKRLGIVRKDMRSWIKHKVPIPLDNEGFPKDYLGYLKKAGYDGLKQSMGEKIAYKKVRNVVK